jgi:hypothetical protein
VGSPRDKDDGRSTAPPGTIGGMSREDDLAGLPRWGSAFHERFWNGYIGDLRRRIRPDFTIDDDTLIALQRSRVVERLDVDASG